MLAICLQFSRRTVATGAPTSNKAEVSVFRVLMINAAHVSPSLEVGTSSHLDTLSGCSPPVASEVSGTSGKGEQVEGVGLVAHMPLVNSLSWPNRRGFGELRVSPLYVY